MNVPPANSTDIRPTRLASQSGGLPGGWWILPSAVLGLIGWIAIFYSIGLIG